MLAHPAPSTSAPSRRPRPFRLLTNADVEHSDADLVEACRRDDEHAWGLLVERHSPRLRWIARQQGLDTAAAEDAVQLGWTDLFTSLDRIEQPAAVGGWLATAVRRHAIRISKLQRRAPASQPAPITESTADERLIADEQAAAVRRAVARLSPAARELLGLLFSTEELSYAEISTRIGRSSGSIGPTRGRCLQRLRDLLNEEVGSATAGWRTPPDAA